VVVISGAYVAIVAGRELRGAQALLTQSADSLSDEDLDTVSTHLRDADAALSSLPADLLRLTPVGRQNVDALRAGVGSALPALTTAKGLRSSLDGLLASRVVEDGSVDLDRLTGLERSLEKQTNTLADLRVTLTTHRTGWLLPPVWDALDDMAGRVADLEAEAGNAARAMRILPPMMGSNDRRTYLIALLNNAELRGAGGILSGLGTVTVEDGRFSVGPFDYYGDIADHRPYRRVAAPDDLTRRYARYRANKTVIVNTSASPDVPEVAVTAQRLYRKVTGTATDGVIVIDPRGVASLMPEATRLRAPVSGEILTRDNIARYVYSDSYQQLDGSTAQRRQGVLSVGEAVTRAITSAGIGGRPMLEGIGGAIRGGHIRFFSSHPGEQDVLHDLGVTGHLRSEEADNLLVVMQNLGADKLDYWMERSLNHTCVLSEETAKCRVEVDIANETPDGLPAYVVQSHKPSYGFYYGYLEIYVPAAADVDGLEVNGKTVSFYREREDGRVSLGTYLNLKQGATKRAVVTYSLPLANETYTLRIDPQPLARDAALRVSLEAPSSWSIKGPAGEEKGSLRYEGALEGPIHFVAGASPGRTGIPALWDLLVRFWTQPIL
jgi:hypothetical protein